jgi:hypothetical protein
MPEANESAGKLSWCGVGGKGRGPRLLTSVHITLIPEHHRDEKPKKAQGLLPFKTRAIALVCMFRVRLLVINHDA